MLIQCSHAAALQRQTNVLRDEQRDLQDKMAQQQTRHERETLDLRAALQTKEAALARPSTEILAMKDTLVRFACIISHKL